MSCARCTDPLIMQLKNTVAIKMEVERPRADGTTSTSPDLDPELAKYVRNVRDVLFQTSSLN